jgi:hypothetical protein
MLFCKHCLNEVTKEYEGDNDEMRNIYCSICKEANYPINEYSIKRIENGKVYQAIVKSIALAMGKDWQYKEPGEDSESSDHYGNIINVVTKQSLSMHYNEHKKQINIAATFPTSSISNEYFRPYEYRQGISRNVSATKKPKLIVSDINRYLMPDYNEAWKIAYTRMQESDNFHNTSSALLLELCTIANCKPNIGKEHSAHFYRTNSAYGDIRASNNNVDLKLHNLTKEQAIQILNIACNC